MLFQPAICTRQNLRSVPPNEAEAGLMEGKGTTFCKYPLLLTPDWLTYSWVMQVSVKEKCDRGFLRSQHFPSVKSESAPYRLKNQSRPPRWPFSPLINTSPMTLDDGMDPGNVLFGCPYCILRYRDHARLDAHVEEIHAHYGEELKCTHPDCHTTFESYSKLILHIKSHTGEKPYQCSFEDCNNRFSSKGNLIKHSGLHTGKRPYQCLFEDCNKRFFDKSGLIRHSSVHTGKKPYQCLFENCDKRFTQSSSLAVHIRVHTGQKSYQCLFDGCQKVFAVKHTMNRHMKKVHKMQEEH